MCHDFGFSAKETHAKLMKTYGEDVISYDTCKVWFAKFKKGDFTFEDAPRLGRPRELDLDVLSQPPSFWEEGIDKLPERWRRVVDGDGAYL